MITGGFGTMIDIKTGSMRRWYVQRDGIKRWVDNDEPTTVKDSLTARTNTNAPNLDASRGDSGDQ